MVNSLIDVNTEQVVDTIIEELEKMVKIPTGPHTMRQQQYLLTLSKLTIIDNLQKLLEQDKYLLERLCHAEMERFK